LDLEGLSSFHWKYYIYISQKGINFLQEIRTLVNPYSYLFILSYETRTILLQSVTLRSTIITRFDTRDDNNNRGHNNIRDRSSTEQKDGLLTTGTESESPE